MRRRPTDPEEWISVPQTTVAEAMPRSAQPEGPPRMIGPAPMAQPEGLPRMIGPVPMIGPALPRLTDLREEPAGRLRRRDRSAWPLRVALAAAPEADPAGRRQPEAGFRP